MATKQIWNGIIMLKTTTTWQEVQEQIQEDLLTYLDGLPNEMLNQVCQIVVNNFNSTNIQN